MDLFEKTVSSEIVYRGEIFDVEKIKVSLPDGNLSNRDVVRHNGGVAIVAMKDDGKILFVEQFRKAIDSTLIEIPAGKLEKGEDPKKCALRELEEETGYRCNNIKFVGKIVMAPGFSDEIIYIYYASELYKGVKGGDEDEFINLNELNLEQVNLMIENGKIFDSKTICAIKFIESFVISE